MTLFGIITKTYIKRKDNLWRKCMQIYLKRTLPDAHLQTIVETSSKTIFLWAFWKFCNSYYQSLHSCKCRIQHVMHLHFLYQLRIKCCFYFSKQMKLKIAILTHIKPIFPIGFLLLFVHSQHNRLWNDVIQSINPTWTGGTINPDSNRFLKWINQE